MTRRLLVMRHAKSSWKDASLADIDRPLNGRGRRDAARAGELLAERGVLPDLVLSSTAVRARQTAERLVRAFGEPVEVETTAYLYHADPGTYAQWAAETVDDVQTLLMVGHNPGIGQWMANWIGSSLHVPTAAIACVTLQGASWFEAIQNHEGSLDWYWYPKLDAP